MSSLRRISAGAGANVLNLVYVTVITALTVPVLIHAWGVPKYGIWIMLTAIPTYLSLSDFGFATAATNEIAMSMAKRNYDQAVQSLHSVWALNLAAAATIICLAGTAGFAMAATGWHADLALVVPALATYAAACLLSRVTLGAFRGSGRYATGTLIYDGFQFIEGGLCLLVAASGGGFFGAALTLLVIRSASILISWGALRYTTPELSIGLKHASKARLRELLAPAFASMSIPVALALNMQGVALVLGAIVSPTATATLSATRTMSRIAVQVISAVNRALVPELSAASARGDQVARARILKLNRLVLIAIVLPAALAFALLGGPAVSLWTSGRIHPPFIAVAFLAVAMALHCVWFFGTNMLSATNAHSRMAGGLLASSFATVMAAYLLGLHYGLSGAAGAVTLGECANLAWFAVVSRDQRVSSLGPKDSKACKPRADDPG